MRITKLQLKNFKRFTNLTLDNIPVTSKLVLLVGTNGSGKSSVFDAFEFLNTISKRQGVGSPNYYEKNQKDQKEVEVVIVSNGKELIYDKKNPFENTFKPLSFYGRTSFRQIPRLTRTQLGQGGNTDFKNDTDRPRFFIEKDNRFENDIEKITEIILKEFYRSKDTKEQILEKYIMPINSALENVFGIGNGTKLKLLEIIPPLEGKVAQITFEKGNSSNIHYDVLSAGEKEVFNILVNLLTRKELYTDTVYFFDEMDLHLNTKLQYNLLKEICENWIPENCQLWTASHSLGFIEYAKQSDLGVIIDFDDLDFDLPQLLSPQSKESLEVYEIAVPKQLLFEMMKDKRVIICENQNDEYYNLLGLSNTVFVGVKDSRDVFIQIKRDARYNSLRDRDFLSDAELEKLKVAYPNHHILRYYDFENYIYHPDNIAEIQPEGFNKEEYVNEIIRQKKERYDYILPTIIAARQTYEEFKTNDKLRDKDTDSIVNDFKNDDFERFYKFFDMKDQFNKAFLSKFNITKEKLSKTKWFKQGIEAILA